MAKAKSNKKEVNEKTKQIKEICDTMKYAQNPIDNIRYNINAQLNPSYLKVVSNDEGSIRIHAKWNDPEIIVNMIY